MRRRAGLLLAFAACAWAASGAARAESPEETFHRANTAYEQGRYDDAAEIYEGLLRYQLRDAVLEYNLANTEFRRGNLGRAILHYERARRLDPTDGEIEANLELARSQCFDRVEPQPVSPPLAWIRGFQDRLGADAQAWTALALFWSIAALVAWGFGRPGGWRASHGWWLAGLALALVVVAGSAWATHRRLYAKRLAVVQAPVVEVLAGPGENNPSLFTVHEGLTLEIVAERDEWLQVSAPNGFNGWLLRGAVEPV